MIFDKNGKIIRRRKGNIFSSANEDGYDMDLNAPCPSTCANNN